MLREGWGQGALWVGSKPATIYVNPPAFETYVGRGRTQGCAVGKGKKSKMGKKKETSKTFPYGTRTLGERSQRENKIRLCQRYYHGFWSTSLMKKKEGTDQSVRSSGSKSQLDLREE